MIGGRVRQMKILMVLQTPWGTDLGMSKVHYDLKIEYEKRGHIVEYLDHRKIYPNGESFFTKLFRDSTQQRILKYLKKHAQKYDVIDANQRCVPFPKEDFGFRGVLLFRSHGLPPLYRIAELSPFYKRMEMQIRADTKSSLKNKLGNFKRYLTQEEGEWALWDSIKHADIVHVLNECEYKYLTDYGVPKDRLVLVSNAVEDKVLDNAQPSQNKLSRERSQVTFIGSWTARKGIVYLPSIFEKLDRYTSSFNLLGTGNEERHIASLFSKVTQQKLNIQTHFSAKKLPEILINTKVGVFPSFVEGFGLAVVEMLALGIPVVAFDIPGPSDILKPIEDSLVVKLGDIDAMIEKVTEILSLSNVEYSVLSKRCYERAQDFKISTIADQFLAIYNKEKANEDIHYHTIV